MFIKPKLAIEDFDYVLPDEQIAYTPAPNRPGSKLLVWDQAIKAESTYAHIAEFIPANATMIFNNSKVIAARILFEKINANNENGNNENANNENASNQNVNSTIEIFCLEPTEKYTPVLLAMQATGKVEWNCLVGGAKKWKEAILTKEVKINDEIIIVRARKLKQDAGKFIIEFSWDHPTIHFSEIINSIGNIPLPPYIQRKASEEDKERYQTTYAIEEGSVAAPTAGLHFSKAVFNSLDEKNIQQQYLTLHVGAGTFMPVKSVTIDAHEMHAEFIEIDIAVINYLIAHVNNLATPIIAVGTTSLRTLESVYWLGVKAYVYNQQNKGDIGLQALSLGQWDAYELMDHAVSVQAALKTLHHLLTINKSDKLITKTQLMVTPGYTFKICDALVTNFHQPKSTLLLIIAAITGNDWKDIYAHAIANKYRFLSYGDGCLFWIKQQHSLSNNTH
jgi:S-adenosylmethionine:tRNA ribosyltransferase-isomerase